MSNTITSSVRSVGSYSIWSAFEMGAPKTVTPDLGRYSTLTSRNPSILPGMRGAFFGSANPDADRMFEAALNIFPA